MNEIKGGATLGAGPLCISIQLSNCNVCKPLSTDCTAKTYGCADPFQTAAGDCWNTDHSYGQVCYGPSIMC